MGLARGSYSRHTLLTELRDALSDIFPIPAMLSETEQKAQSAGKPLPSALAAAAAAAEPRGGPPARSRAGAPGAPEKPPPLAPALAAQAAGRGRLSPHSVTLTLA